MSTDKRRATSTHRGRKPQVPAHTWHDTFLAELRQCGNVRAACYRAKVERSTVYRARKEDPEFAEAWKSALEDAIDSLEAEAWRRARDGNRKLVLFQGKPVKVGRRNLIEVEYSDTLMTLLLKAHRPDKFRERSDTMNWNVDVSQLNDVQLERISNGEDPRVVLATSSPGGAGTAPAPES